MHGYCARILLAAGSSLLIGVTPQLAQARTKATVLAALSPSDGDDLTSPLLEDQSGNFYGVAQRGGSTKGKCGAMPGIKWNVYLL
jgi:hypothetical protein